MRRLAVFLLVMLFAGRSLSQSTGPVSGKVEAVTATSVAVRVGKDLVTATWNPKTRFWRGRRAAAATDFRAGETVWARIKTNVSPNVLRELADVESWVWLETCRKSIRNGVVTSVDPKYAFIRFADGTAMPYRVTPKSKITLKGKPATLIDLKENQMLWLKGRTLATLDLWLVSASDVQPPAEPIKVEKAPKAASAEKSGSKPRSKRAPVQQEAKPLRLGMVGDLTGKVRGVTRGMYMFDIDCSGVLLHISFTRATLFTIRGQRADPNELLTEMIVRISYRRDGYGRIFATRINVIG